MHTLNNQQQKPIIWSIAGSDSSGGAGIQADIKTAHSLNCEICTLITANTIQNSQQVLAINPTDTQTLQLAWQSLIEDKPPAVIKIGLIANNEQLAWLATNISAIKKYNAACRVIFDPVLKATVGNSLQTEILDWGLLKKLLLQVEVITPNCLEAEYLINIFDAGKAPSQSHHLKTWANIDLAKQLHSCGIRGAVLTGGHSIKHKKVIDAYYGEIGDGEIKKRETALFTLASPYIETNFSHGSGCSFATALSCFLAHNYLMRDAFMQAKAFINKSFTLSQINEKNAKVPTGYYGALQQAMWPVEKKFYPRVIEAKNSPLSPDGFASCGTQQLGLYPVIDSLEWLQRLLPLGLEIIQLRVKNQTQTELDQIIQQAVEMAKPFKTRLFINDYWQLAIKHQAYGVHLGQEDLLEANLAAIQKAGLRLGISTHGCYEFKYAEQFKPSYLAIGAIFPTQTKDMTGQIQGLQNLQHMLQIQTSSIPVVAIGGITLERAVKVLQTGIKSIAVVTAITQSSQPEQTVADWQTLFKTIESTT